MKTKSIADLQSTGDASVKRYGGTRKCSDVTCIQRVQLLSLQTSFNLCSLSNPIGLHMARVIYKYLYAIVVESVLVERICDPIALFVDFKGPAVNPESRTGSDIL